MGLFRKQSFHFHSVLTSESPPRKPKRKAKTLHHFDADAGAQVEHSNCFRWPS